MMKKPNVLAHMVKAALASTVIAGSFAGTAFAQDPYQLDMDYGRSSQGSSQGSQGQQNQKVNVKEVLVDPDVKAPMKLDDLDYELMLYENEQLEIDARKRAIMKRLYEDKQLDRFRELLFEEMRKEAVDDAKLEVSKLKPEEIRLLRAYRSDISQAENAPLREVEQLIRTKDVPLDTNRPLTVYVSANNQSSLVFFDSAGNPWPIAGEPIFNEESFSAFKTGEKEHIVVFTITKEFSESNAMINLKGLDIPIPIKLVGTESKVDARLKARVPRMGPLMSQKPQIYNQVTAKASPEMMEVLNGQHVKDSLAYNIVSIDGGKDLGRAYYRDGKIYVRTPHELIIPGPTGASKLLSGYRAFVAPARQDLLLMADGQQVEARLTKALDLKLTEEESIFDKAGN